MFSKISSMIALASGASWDYSTNGADWPSINSDCALTNQSPINLISPGTEDFKYEIYGSDEDSIEKGYSNQIDGTMFFNGHTTQLNLDEADGANGFKSELGKTLFGSTTEFSGA
jgi:carbonic anhydrase